MANNKFVMAIIGVVTSILVVSAVLIPVVSDALNSKSEGSVLYTNNGDWYYNEVTNDTNTTINFKIGNYSDEYGEFAYLMISIDDGEWIATTYPDWTSEYSMYFNSLPLFTFKTNDGKYGVEGIATIGNESMDAQYIAAAGGVMYYRFIEGQTPELYYCFDIDSLAPLTITMTNGVVSYSSFNQTPTALNGTYLLSITDGTTGDFTLMSGPTVLNDTPFYMADFNGDVSIEVDDEEGSSSIVLGEAIGAGCYGQISDYNNASKLCIYDFGRNYNTITSSISTNDAESGDGLVLDEVTITADGTEQLPLTHFIVPVNIREMTSTVSSEVATLLNVIPLFVIISVLIAVVTMFIKRQ